MEERFNLCLDFHICLKGVLKNVTWRFGFASFLSSLILMLQCVIMISTPNLIYQKHMKRGIENFFVSLKGSQRNLEYAVSLLSLKNLELKIPLQCYFNAFEFKI